MRTTRPAGILPPVPTPFGESGELATAELARNFEHWARYPLAGYVVLGSNGEAVHLDEAETSAVLETARAAIPTDRWLIAGTGRHGTAATVTATRAAAAAGADAALVLPPSYYRGQMTGEVLVRHFHAVADASPIPLLIYNMPACTGLDLQAATVVAAAAHENIIGLKDSGGDVAKLGEIRRQGPPDFAILAGSAGFLLPALEAGADGGVLGLANIAPAACLEIVAARERGETDTAREIQERLVRPNAAVTREWGVAAMKAALDLLGLYGGPPRAPLQPLDTVRTAELNDILAAAGILPADQGEK
jgi:4-hydroxy-2-oxoglutarate aldolase